MSASDTLCPSENFGIAMQRVMGRHLANFLLILLPVLFFGLVQGFRYGFGQKDYGFLAVGSFISVVLTLGYGVVAICEAYGTPRRLWMYLAVWGGMLPYLFIVYLTFYRGVWGFIQSLLTINAWGMLSGVLFAALGLFAISLLKLITDCSGHISMLLKSEQVAQQS
jgi:hypothetical protein